ncbi:MAG: collagen-like protein [Patulibacter minatonensis]
MPRLPRPRLSYANVTASLALFVALGGTSYAVTQLPKNSVGSTQLKKGAVTNAKLAKGSVSADKLASSTVVTGPAGARGPRGAEGPAGPVGPAGSSNAVFKSSVGLMLGGEKGSKPVQSIRITPGTWLVTATGSFVGGQEDYYRCSLPSPEGAFGVVARPMTAGADSYALQSYLQVSGDTTVTLSCGHDGDHTTANARIDHAQLSAVRVNTLDIQK